MTAVATPAAYTPVPPGRGLWRLTLHRRAFVAGVYPSGSGIAEITHATGRRLDQLWNQPAQLTFTVDGRSQSAMSITELSVDVIAWRWDTTAGRDVPMFRGPVTQSEDQISEQSHTVTFTCHDYSAVLARRYVTHNTPLVYTATPQDQIAFQLVDYARFSLVATDGTSLRPGCYLPLGVLLVNPDGTTRAVTGPTRDRSYLGGQEILAGITDLAAVLGGFDFDVWPRSDIYGDDQLRIFFPVQGVTRTDMVLNYGGTVATVTRSVNSADYSNYVRVLGNNTNTDQTAPQTSADDWNGDASNGSAGAVGTWMTHIAAADVTVSTTLLEQAQGALALDGLLVPSYTLGLTPGLYVPGSPNMGDTVPLVIKSGRLNISTTVRVVGISYDIGDDGNEDVSLTVGRPTVAFSELIRARGHDIDALARR